MGGDNIPEKEVRHLVPHFLPYPHTMRLCSVLFIYFCVSAFVRSEAFLKAQNHFRPASLIPNERTAPHFRDSKRFLLNAKINTKPLGSSLWEFSLLVSLYFFMLIYKYEQKTQNSRLLSGFVTLWRVAGRELNE